MSYVIKQQFHAYRVFDRIPSSTFENKCLQLADIIETVTCTSAYKYYLRIFTMDLFKQAITTKQMCYFSISLF